METNRIEHSNNEIRAYVGPQATNVVRLISIKAAIRMSMIGMKLCRNQPSMRDLKAEVEKVTGRKFKANQKQEMMDALTRVIQSEKQRLGVEVQA